MSVDQDDRDRGAELASPATGHRGIPVDAICTGCQKIRVKRTTQDVGLSDLEASDLASFKHVCHRCQVVTWWNPVAVLSGVIDSERGDDGE